MHKLSWVTVYIQNPREPRQVIMTKLVKVGGDIKIHSVSIQSKNIKNPEKNFKVFFFSTAKRKSIKYRN